jgi:hypothetical protein
MRLLMSSPGFDLRRLHGKSHVPGVLEPKTTVLQIDCYLPDSPGALGRVLDELVTTPDGRLLSRAHLKTERGRWAAVAYFALIPAEEVIGA